jgi:hypothetical protein
MESSGATAAGILGAALMFLLGNPCAAQPPDSLAVESLRLALQRRPWVRVESRWDTARLIKPRVTTTGLGFSEARPDEPGADIGTLPNPIPLAQIHRVEVPVNAAGKGLLFGALVGGVLGLATAAMEDQVDLGPTFRKTPPPHDRVGDYVTYATLGTLPGAAVGALIGSAFRDMKEIYPPAAPLNGRAR